MNDTADSLPQASDAEISELIGSAVTTPAPAAPATQAQTAKEAASAASTQPDKAASAPADPLSRIGEHREGKKARDFTGLDENEARLFDKMSNDAYKTLYPIYLAHKKGAPPEDVKEKLTTYERQLAEAESRRWHDHPDAYKLSEEYQTASQHHDLARDIANHWEKQLVDVDGGAKEYLALTQDRDGNVVRVKTPVTNVTRADLMRRIALSQHDIQQASAGLEAVKGEHSKRYGGYKTALGGIYDKHFKPHEALLDKHMKAALETFPPWFRKTEEAKLLAASLASNQILTEHYERQQGASSAAAVFDSAGKAGGPTQAALEKTGVVPDGKASALPSKKEVEEFAARYL